MEDFFITFSLEPKNKIYWKLPGMETQKNVL